MAVLSSLKKIEMSLVNLPTLDLQSSFENLCKTFKENEVEEVNIDIGPDGALSKKALTSLIDLFSTTTSIEKLTARFKIAQECQGLTPELFKSLSSGSIKYLDFSQVPINSIFLQSMATGNYTKLNDLKINLEFDATTDEEVFTNLKDFVAKVRRIGLFITFAKTFTHQQFVKLCEKMISMSKSIFTLGFDVYNS